MFRCVVCIVFVYVRVRLCFSLLLLTFQGRLPVALALRLVLALRTVYGVAYEGESHLHHRVSLSTYLRTVYRIGV